MTSCLCRGKMLGDPGTPADSYYQVRPECTDVPPSKFRVKAGKTLSVRKWGAAFSPEGYLDMKKILERIYRGGIHPSIRGEVWEFLLGLYDPNSTFEERKQIQQRRREEYRMLKEECQRMFPLIGSGKFVTAPIITENGRPTQDPIVLHQIDGIQRNGNDDISHGSQLANQPNGDLPLDEKEIQWKLTLHQIGLDVVRTDRILVFYENQEKLSRLWDVLAVYAWFDLEVGYCQGMSDLCSPMILLVEDEADAFWCFEHLMWRMRGNFRCTGRSVGVEAQLGRLAAVTQAVNPELHNHLETLGGGGYLFAIRMLMVLFRREFSFVDSLYLWEMMWALEYDPELFSLYEDHRSASEKLEGSKRKGKLKQQHGKFERRNLKNRGKDYVAPLPIYIFVVAGVLKDQGSKLKKAQGLDEVVKILNDTTGMLDAKKACRGAMKLHKKYLKKAKHA